MVTSWLALAPGLGQLTVPAMIYAGAITAMTASAASRDSGSRRRAALCYPAALPAVGMTTEPRCPRCLQVISPDETVELDGARVVRARRRLLSDLERGAPPVPGESLRISLKERT